MQYTLEDFLVKLHMGQWFGWSDSKNKTYANLVIHSADTKPTEQECIDGVAALQAEYDATQYQRDRQTEYPSINDLIVALWENVVEERASAVVSLEAKRQAVKTKYPKP